MMNNIIKQNLIGILLGTGFTIASYVIGYGFGKIETINWIEFFAVFTSYICTYLCVMQSRTNYLWGFVTVILYSILFYSGSLYASMALNLYLIPVMIWGWYWWRSDLRPRPVSTVGWWWPVYLVFTGLVWYNLTLFCEYLGAALPASDSAILVLSILAQFLLDQKKLENWIVWAAVNVFAIYTYFSADMFLVGVQYVLFLANTVFGGVMWYRSWARKADYVR